MMKNFFVFTIVVFFGLQFSASPARAEESPAVQKAFENAKQYLDDLVTAKDENNSDDVGLRVETFRQVLDLSAAEAKDFEFRMLAADKDKDEVLTIWKKSALNGITQSLVFFDLQGQLISDSKLIDVAKIKQIAQDFKSWREKNYLPLTDQIQGFLLIKQEMKAIQTAQARLQKITGDLKNLRQSRIVNSTEIKKSLENSKGLIGQAGDLNGQAKDLFIKLYANVATSSSPIASGTIAIFPGTATSTITNSTSTATSSPADASAPVPIVSIKDLVRSSLGKIKDAYQEFIDISNLVRKLLG